jgi:hypothetical protein
MQFIVTLDVSAVLARQKFFNEVHETMKADGRSL